MQTPRFTESKSESTGKHKMLCTTQKEKLPPIHGKVSEFIRLIQISKRLKSGEKKKKPVSENDGVQCIHILTGSLCKMYFLLWVMVSGV